jgi:DNA-binding Xre family transcriptional regulator
MLKKDLRVAAGLSTNVIAKMGKNQDVSTESLRKICKALNCELTDIVEFVNED